MDSREHTQANLQLLREKLDSGRLRSARLMIHSLHPAEIARLIESVDLQTRAVLWEMVGPEDEGDVLVELAASAEGPLALLWSRVASTVISRTC